MKSIPIPASKCYACSSRAIGVTRRYVGDKSYIEAACTRHRDPTIKAHEGCVYCGGPVRAGAILIDDMYAHGACVREYDRD